MKRTKGASAAMKTIEVEGIELAVEDQGQGSPVVLAKNSMRKVVPGLLSRLPLMTMLPPPSVAAEVKSG